MCTSSGWFKHIEHPQTFSNHIITEIARCGEFCCVSSRWFDCTEPSLSTLLQRGNGVQGAYALVRGGSIPAADRWLAETTDAGVSVEGIYMGSLAHADDLRSLTCDPQSSRQQAQIINEFLAENFLQLNTNKCELVVHTHGVQSNSISVDVGHVSLKPSKAAKCLGIWWTPDLSPAKAITENINSARRAFFSYLVQSLICQCCCLGLRVGTLQTLSWRN